MEVLHSKLKDIIIQTIINHALSHSDRCGNARQGAQDLFNFFREQIKEEIYLLYFTKCQQDFFNEYHFENIEPYIKGLMEARYYIIRMFHISFCEYFQLMERCLPDNIIDKKETVTKSKISA